MGAQHLKLTAQEVEKIRELAVAMEGTPRYPAIGAALLLGNTPPLE